jgi:hypothetical protein
MKKIVINFVMLVIGFISGIYAILRLIIWSDGTLHGFKIAIIERFEYLLLGYNTIKGPRKSYYHSSCIRRPYSNYRTSYRDYYGDKGFEEDEEAEND